MCTHERLTSVSTTTTNPPSKAFSIPCKAPRTVPHQVNVPWRTSCRAAPPMPRARAPWSRLMPGSALTPVCLPAGPLANGSSQSSPVEEGAWPNQERIVNQVGLQIP